MRPFIGLACLLCPLVLAGCSGTPPAGGRTPGGEVEGAEAGLPAGARWSIPRLAPNGRALYALPELDALAEGLLGALASRRAGEGEPLRLGFFRFKVDGEPRSYTGDAMAQDLSTLVARRADPRVEVYTRQKTERVLAEKHWDPSRAKDLKAALEAGKAGGGLEGIQAVVLGRVTLRGQAQALVNCQVVDLTTGAMLAGEIAKVPLGEASVEAFDAEGAGTRAAADLFGALPPPPEGQAAWRVAVWDIERGKARFEFADPVMDVLGTRLGNRPGIEQLPRLTLEEREQARRQERSGAFDPAFEPGMETRAELVVGGFAESFRDCHALNFQMIDLRGRILGGTILVFRP